jgi:hypothetical protein
MKGSRFDWRQPLTLERLKCFVALDNITAQVPLIEVTDRGQIKIWTAYDITRTQGTYTQVLSNGMVKTVTVYPSGRKSEIINRGKTR